MHKLCILISNYQFLQIYIKTQKGYNNKKLIRSDESLKLM